MVDTVWASFWGFFYRKFFWDFVNGIMRDPGGIQCVCSPPIFQLDFLTFILSDRPAKQDAFFITIIVKAPIIQIITMLIAFFMIALEFPIPQLKGLAIYRSIPFRIVMLFFQSFFCILFYQVSLFQCL